MGAGNGIEIESALPCIAMPFLDENTLLDPLSPSDMVQRQMEQVDFKPRSAALFYQVAVTESLAKDRAPAVAGCLDVLLALADELQAFRAPLLAIHACLEEAVFDGPGKPHFQRAEELDGDVEKLEEANIQLEEHLLLLKEQKQTVIPELERLHSELRALWLERDSLNMQLEEALAREQALIEEVAQTKRNCERNERAMCEVVADHKLSVQEGQAQIANLESMMSRLNSKQVFLAEAEEQVIEGSGVSEFVRLSRSSELVEAKLLERQLWALVEAQFREFGVHEEQLETKGEAEELAKMRRQFGRQMSSTLRELEALSVHIDTFKTHHTHLASKDANLSIGTTKNRPKVLVSRDGGTTFTQMTPPTFCSICGESVSSCPHRRYGDGLHLLWAVELPEGATHMRLSWIPEPILDEHEKHGRLSDTQTTGTTVGALWDEFRSLPHGPSLNPHVSALYSIDELHQILAGFHQDMLESEADSEKWLALRKSGFVQLRVMEQLGIHFDHKFGGATEAAHVALFYLLKALSKRQSKPRLQMFNEVLLGRVEPSYWIAVEVLAQVVVRAMPTEVISWTGKLEEAMLRRLFGAVADSSKLEMLRGEFGHFLSSRSNASGDNSSEKADKSDTSTFKMRDMMVEFACELSRRNADPFFEYWLEKLEQAVRENPDYCEGNSLSSDLLVEMVLNHSGCKIPPKMEEHVEALLRYKFERATECHAFKVTTLRLTNDLGQPLPSHLGLKEVAVLAASFHVAHLVHT